MSSDASGRWEEPPVILWSWGTEQHSWGPSSELWLPYFTAWVLQELRAMKNREEKGTFSNSLSKFIRVLSCTALHLNAVFVDGSPPAGWPHNQQTIPSPCITEVIGRSCTRRAAHTTQQPLAPHLSACFQQPPSPRAHLRGRLSLSVETRGPHRRRGRAARPARPQVTGRRSAAGRGYWEAPGAEQLLPAAAAARRLGAERAAEGSGAGRARGSMGGGTSTRRRAEGRPARGSGWGPAAGGAAPGLTWRRGRLGRCSAPPLRALPVRPPWGAVRRVGRVAGREALRAFPPQREREKSRRAAGRSGWSLTSVTGAACSVRAN